MKAIVSEKGQVTIPHKLRARLGLKAGQVLEFDTKDGLLIARKAVSTDSLDEVTGILSDRIRVMNTGTGLSRKLASRDGEIVTTLGCQNFFGEPFTPAEPPDLEDSALLRVLWTRYQEDHHF